ncbi:helix-turn-helix domain-containing protein [Paenibacillus alginolyticus]|uniref:helix-turn-helix domain-containing protein n=1 Tax=Paenibacillus alginolyticus TaxID=59839 RepID=UPI000407E270|nr:helix-turn-helix transcriptional regulator [Paenibacillus alginolyticus]MCY9670670.1 helix-turn-helix domain-containing protein [Paenibacillus alginolyticus]
MDEDEYYKVVGVQIRTIRLTREQSQSALSQRLNISRPSLANIEAGRQRIHLYLLFQISNELKVPVNKLFPGTSE